MLRKVIQLIRYNFNTLIKFELLYKLLTLFIFSPLFSIIFKIVMKINGFSYLTIENIIEFIKKPLTIYTFIVFVILLLLYTIFEISTVLVIFDASRQKQKVSLRQSLKVSIKKSFKILKIRNIGLVFVLLFLMPFLNLGITTSLISSIRIPEYIMDFISSNILYLSLYFTLFVILAYIFFRLIYTVNYVVLDDVSFRKARKLSEQLTKGRFLKDFIKIILTEGIIYLLYIIFVFIGILLIVLINRFIGSYTIINSLLITIIWLYLAFSLILFTLISTPISFAAISYMFYNHKLDNNEEIKSIYFEEIEEKRKNKDFSFVKVIAIVILIISGSYFTHGVLSGKFNLNIETQRDIEITAHRGASVDYPENTMIAFIEAKKLGADWVELDVQATKDNAIIVMHDSNLKRITGVNKNVWELDYSEISKLDAGSKFNKKFQNERIPLLKEVISWAKNNQIKLNIELKPTLHEVNFEQTVVDIVKEFDYENNVVLTSSNYQVLKNIKKYDKSIKTIYVMSLAYGDLNKLKYADGFSIESTNITNSLVYSIHEKGKQVYAWTLNKEDTINSMIKLNVDNIITDDITLAKKSVEESRSTNIIFLYYEFVRDLF